MSVTSSFVSNLMNWLMKQFVNHIVANYITTSKAVVHELMNNNLLM